MRFLLPRRRGLEEEEEETKRDLVGAFFEANRPFLKPFVAAAGLALGAAAEDVDAVVDFEAATAVVVAVTAAAGSDSSKMP